ncbi:MAG: DUF853 family protein [Bacteroidaceae bacterium]|nr:DUF853 family protein [Bacteroidaceae bacterium]
MYDSEKGLYVAHCEAGPLSICGRMANRHGLIAGATGTGKTVSLQVLAETFSQAGVPCFMADMKGDLSGISQAGSMTGFIQKRCVEFGIGNPQFAPCPVRFFDVFGEQGHPMRTTISNMGPQLLSRLMQLNEVQEGILNVLFRVADERGLLLIDIKDLRAMLSYLSEHAAEITRTYGTVTPISIGAIQRALLALENEGAEKFFGEPSFDIFDLLQCEGGRGVMSVLAADRLMLNPKLYSTFLLWLLSDLYAQLPEVGDLALPKLVFFFDEAHTLFEDTSKALVDKIEQVIRLIRSKGVGIYFVTQNPTDIPEDILGQLGNRVQHALRAYTPKEQKAVRTAAQTFRANPSFKTEDAIMQLETGEALVSFLDEKGAPMVVQRSKMLFPLSQIGVITEQQRTQLINSSRLYGRYDHMIDRESAFEVLLAESEQKAIEARKAQEAAEAEKERRRIEKQRESEERALDKMRQNEEKTAKKGKKSKDSLAKTLTTAAVGAAIGSVSRSVGTSVSNKITGKKSSSTTPKSVAGKAASSAASSVVRTLTRSILGNLLK